MAKPISCHAHLAAMSKTPDETTFESFVKTNITYKILWKQLVLLKLQNTRFMIKVVFDNHQIKMRHQKIT